MSRQEPKLSSFRTNEARLLKELNQAVDDLGRLDVFKPGKAGAAAVPKVAWKPAFDFAAIYGNCMWVGIDLESELYVPSEIPAHVALAAAAAMHNEGQELEKLLHGVGSLTIKQKRERAQAIFQQYLRMAAAYATIQLATEQYRRLIHKVVQSLSERERIEREDPFFKEIGWAHKAYEDARLLMSNRSWQIKGDIKLEINNWKNSAEDDYWDVISPFL